MKNGISLCMIVKNEEHFLEGCLKSAQGIVDEIIIVDTGSTDATLDIARKYTNKIFHFQWIDDFSAARNFAKSHASYEWILSLDADERIISLDKDFILKKSKDLSVDGFETIILNRKFHTDNSVITHFPHKAIRIFRNSNEIIFEGKIHEDVSKSIFQRKTNVLSDHCILEHLGYQEKNPEKNQRNIKLLEAAIKENPDHYVYYFYLGNEYFSLSQYQEALNHYKQFLDLAKNKEVSYSNDILMQAGLRVAYCNYLLGQKEKALEIIKEWYGKISEDIFEKILFLPIAAQIAGENRFIREALSYYNEFIELISKNQNIVPFISLDEIYLNMGHLLYESGYFHEAIPFYQKATNNKNEIPYVLLGTCYLKTGMISEAYTSFQRALQINSHSQPAQKGMMICQQLKTTNVNIKE